MAGSEYLLLINDSLKRYMDALSSSELGRLREKLSFLAAGLWEGGLRVKKLHGRGRAVVFEARVSKGDRLLFTLGRDRGMSLIYAWGVESHDRVNRAKASILPDNAPFLSFEPSGEAGSEEHLELLELDTLTAEYFSQAPMESIEAEDCGPQRWRLLDDSDWIRLLESAERARVDLRLHLTEDQRNFLAEAPPLFLSGTAGSGKTTIAVYYLLRELPDTKRRLFVTWHRYLCTWSEGLYDGLVGGGKRDGQTHPRFAPWREIVTEIVASGPPHDRASFPEDREVDLAGFERMMTSRKEFGAIDPELAWEEIRGIIKGAKPTFNLARYAGIVSRLSSGQLTARETRELGEALASVESLGFMGKLDGIVARRTPFADFAQFARQSTTPGAVDRASLVEVHRHVLDLAGKHKTELGRSLLSFDAYLALGKKRAPRFGGRRELIYSIAEWYQERLLAEGLWDDIDLARRAIAILSDDARDAASEPWDLIVCDEAQDFTNIHFSLMFRLVRDPSRLVLAGDVKQIINPSGFRWGDVRALFWERGLAAPELRRLNLNFRSVGGIVALGNALLDLKKRLAGIQSDEAKERWKFTGLLPCLLTGSEEEDVAAAIPATGAANAILVRDAAMRDRIKAQAKTDLVFTIPEAKGLEFDSILLWRLTPQDGELAGLWRRLKTDELQAADFEARIVHEINLFYVAATRARNGLVIYETNSDFWSQAEFQDLFVPSHDPSVLEAYWRQVSTPAEWKKQGDYYLEREHWMAAAECYRNSGDSNAEARAAAFGHSAAGRHAEAAPCFEVAGLALKAAEAWELAGEPERAITLWESLKKPKRVKACQAMVLDKGKRHAEAAALWLELRDREAAKRSLAKAPLDPAAGEVYRALKLWDKAAASYAKSGKPARAAECSLKAGDRPKAAEYLLAAGEVEVALAMFRKLRDWKKEAECLVRLGRLDELARRQVDQGDYGKGFESLHKWLETDPSRTETLRAAAGVVAASNPSYAGICFSVLGDPGSAAPLFMKARNYLLALNEWRGLKDHENASTCLAALDRHLEAAEALEAAGVRGDRIVALLRRHVGTKAGKVTDRKRSEALNEEAYARGELGFHDRAIDRFVAIGHISATPAEYAKADRDEEAFLVFLAYKAWDSFEEFLERKPRPRFSHAWILEHAEALRYRDLEGKDEKYALPWLLRAVIASYAQGSCDSEELRKEVRALLPSRGMNLLLEPYLVERHLPLIDQLIRICHLDALLALSLAMKPINAGKKYISEFWRRIDAAAAVGKPRAACFAALGAFRRGRPAKMELPCAELDPWSVELYEETGKPSILILDWFVERGLETEMLAHIAHFDLFALAAFWARERKDFVRSARWYEIARDWKSAHDAYHSAGDLKGCARMLEKLGNLHEALALWQTIGDAKTCARLGKKIAKAGLTATPVPKPPLAPSQYLQQELF